MSWYQKGQKLNLPCDQEGCDGSIIMDIDKADSVNYMDIKCNKCNHVAHVNTKQLMQELYEKTKKELSKHFKLV